MSAGTCSDCGAAHLASWNVRDYDLDQTLSCGQAFRWRQDARGWSSVVLGRWVRLSSEGRVLRAETVAPQKQWGWLEDYLQIHVALDSVLGTFPDDEPMRSAVAACRGLRLLRQDAWECLASFLLSATKQIIQIQQIIAVLCARYGERVPAPAGEPPAFTFPTAARLASLREADLRACKMGFRAAHLLAAARAVADGTLDLQQLRTRSLDDARQRLMQLEGVGPKIADCVLLFSCGFERAFPVDVWVQRALRRLYFRNRKVAPRQLRDFAVSHFGPYAGYAQQYLFHYVRTRLARPRHRNAE